MRSSQVLFRNLNKKHWDRRVWEIGYKGPLLPQQKATGRPSYPVTGNMVSVVRERLDREWRVMNMLTKPYIDEDTEKRYWTTQGVKDYDDWEERKRKEKRDVAMPGKPKSTSSSDLKKRGNIGNLLHSHTTYRNIRS